MSDRFGFYGRVVREEASVAPEGRLFLCMGVLLTSLAHDVEVPVNEVPRDAASVRALVAARRAEAAAAAEDGSGESGTDEAAEAEVAKPAEKSETRGAKQRCPVLVRDRSGKVPFAHLGMYVSAQLVRGKQLVDAPIDWRDYEYELLYVRRAAATQRVRAVDWRRALATASVRDLMARDRELAARSERQRRKQMPLFPAVHRDIALAKELTRADMSATQATAAARVPEAAAGLRRQLWARYATERGALQPLGTNENAEPRTLYDLLGALSLDGRRAADAPLCDVLALVQLADEFADYEPQPARLLFFGAAVPLPPHAAGARSTLACWAGARLSKSARLAGELLGDDELSNARAYAVLEFAHSLQRCVFNIQRAQLNVRYRDTTFDADRFVAYERRSRGQPRDAEQEVAAISFLLRERVWRVPSASVRLALRGRADDGLDAGQQPAIGATLLMCSERDWCAERALADALLELAPLLVDCGAERVAHYARSARLETLLIEHDALFCGRDVADVLWLTAGTSASALRSVDAFVAHATHDANEARYVADLVAYDAVVVCDVHRLERHELTMVARVLNAAVRERAAWSSAPRARLHVVLAGDANVTASPFAHAVRSEALRTVELRAGGGERASADSSSASASGGEDDGWLRTALHHASAGAAWRARAIEQLFAAEGGVRLAPHVDQLAEMAAESVVVDGSRTSRRRWLLLAERAAQLTNTWLALADELDRARSGAGRALGRQLRRMAEAPRPAVVADATLLFAAPFVGWRRRAVRVQRAWLADDRLESDRTHFERNSRAEFIDPSSELKAALDLDDPRLLLELEPGEYADHDHRVCCRTWSPDVLHVAAHRHELGSQSFVLARDALPLADAAVELVACAPLGATDAAGSFAYEDLYAALVDAAGGARHPLVLGGVERARVPASFEARRARPRHMLERMLRS